MSEHIVLDGTYKNKKNDYENHAFQAERKAQNVRLWDEASQNCLFFKYGAVEIYLSLKVNFGLWSVD